jgi:hypothetical protein
MVHRMSGRSGTAGAGGAISGRSGRGAGDEAVAGGVALVTFAGLNFVVVIHRSHAAWNGCAC